MINNINKEYDDLTNNVAIFSYNGKLVNIPFKYNNEKILKNMPLSFYFSHSSYMIVLCTLMGSFGILLPIKFALLDILLIIILGSLSNLYISRKWKRVGDYFDIPIRNHEKEYKIAEDILVKNKKYINYDRV